MNHNSPFSDARYEPELMTYFFLPGRDFIFDFSKFQIPQSTYLFGSRGTGKTTLLHALDAKRRMDKRDNSLRDALTEFPESPPILGFYMKVSDSSFSLLNSYLEKHCQHDDTYLNLFSLYLDLIWLPNLLKVLHQKSIENELPISVENERNYLQAIIDEDETIRTIVCKHGAPTFLSTARALREMSRSFNAKISFPDEQIRVDEPYLRFEVGELGHAFCDKLDILLEKTQLDRQGWIIKVLVDEAENLTEKERTALNTIVRCARSPISYTIAYVSHPDSINTSETFREQLRSDAHDAQIILSFYNLEPDDEHTLRLDKQFKYYVEGVIKARLRYRFNLNIDFSTEALLGKLDINDLLTRILSDSESPAAQRLIESAKQLKEDGLFSKEVSLPIYQAFLFDNNAASKGNLLKDGERRRQESQEIRKKMVAAYLAICKEYRKEPSGPLYASSDMLLQMSDNCIRDYLRQMDAIFQEVDKTPKEFISMSIDVAVQNRALNDASKKKRKSLKSRDLPHPDVINQFVNGLARITVDIQTSDTIEKLLRSTERGIFVVDISGDSKRTNNIVKLVNQAADYGFLIIKKRTNSMLAFRVHCSLSAAFGFSYRGAYYTIPISIDVLHRMAFGRQEESELTVKNYISQILKISDSDQFSLFGRNNRGNGDDDNV